MLVRTLTSIVRVSTQELLCSQAFNIKFLATINTALCFSGRIPPVQGGDAGSIPASAIKYGPCAERDVFVPRHEFCSPAKLVNQDFIVK